jgi:hypothetical protein
LNAFSIAHMLNRGAWNIDGVHILEKGDLYKSTIVIIWILEHFAKPTSA